MRSSSPRWTRLRQRSTATSTSPGLAEFPEADVALDVCETVQGAGTFEGRFGTVGDNGEDLLVVNARLLQLLPGDRLLAATEGFSAGHAMKEGIGRGERLFQIGDGVGPAFIEVTGRGALRHDHLVELAHLVPEEIGAPEVIDEAVGRREERKSGTSRHGAGAEELGFLFHPLPHDPLPGILEGEAGLERAELIAHLTQIDGTLRRVEREASVDHFPIEPVLAAEAEGGSPDHFPRALQILDKSLEVENHGPPSALQELMLALLQAAEPEEKAVVDEAAGDEPEAETSHFCKRPSPRGRPAEIEVMDVAHETRAEIQHDRHRIGRVAGEEDIAGMKMTVIDPVLVQVPEGFGELADDLPGRRLFHPSEPRERPPLDPLHHHHVGGPVEAKS